jgi:N-acetylglutamate synthase-like GNAT family acetyltransferase
MNIQIIDFKPKYRSYFETLNKAWIEEYFIVEPIDKYVLENPETAILKDGGRIYFAEYNGKIIGTVALKFIESGVYELTKMAVDKTYHGIGAGKLLCKAAIEKAKELNASILILYTQSRLLAAIGIYKQLGFIRIPMEDQLYKRSDIKMELHFTAIKNNVTENKSTYNLTKD